MRADVKAWNRGIDVRDLARRIDLKAESEGDAALLSALAGAMFYWSNGSRQRLWEFLQKEKRKAERQERKVESGKSPK